MPSPLATCPPQNHDPGYATAVEYVVMTPVLLPHACIPTIFTIKLITVILFGRTDCEEAIRSINTPTKLHALRVWSFV